MFLNGLIVKGNRKEASIYTGEMKAGRRHGTGVLLHRSGSKYSGQWSENVKEGKRETTGIPMAITMPVRFTTTLCTGPAIRFRRRQRLRRNIPQPMSGTAPEL